MKAFSVRLLLGIWVAFAVIGCVFPDNEGDGGSSGPDGIVDGQDSDSGDQDTDGSETDSDDQDTEEEDTDGDPPDNDAFTIGGEDWHMALEADGSIVLAGSIPDRAATAVWLDKSGQELSVVEMKGNIDDFFAFQSGGFAATEFWGDEKFAVNHYTSQGASWRIDLPGRVSFEEPMFSVECNADYVTAMSGSGDSLIVMGAFSGVLVLGEGQENETQLGTAGDKSLNTFMARFSKDGMLQQAVETTLKIVPDALAVADDGTVFVFGVNHPMESPLTAAIDAQGNALWVNDQGAIDPEGLQFFDYKVKVLAAQDGAYFLVGDFYENVILTDRFGGQILLHAPVYVHEGGWISYQGYFIAMYSENGELLWAQNTYEGNPYNCASVLATGAALLNGEELVIAGKQLNGAVTFGKGETSETLVEEPGQFIAAYRPDGTLGWIRTFADAHVSFGAGVQTDANEMYFAGKLKGELVLDDGTVLFGEGDKGEFLLLRQGDL